MSPRKELDLGNWFLMQTSRIGCKGLCKLDVLELKDKPTGDKKIVYKSNSPGI